MLSFLLHSICTNSHLLSLSIAARCCRGLPLTYCVCYAVQYTVAAAAIPRPILWAGRFFVGRSSAGDGDGATEAAVAVPPSGTLSTFSRPLCLILSSRVSTVAVLVVPHICFHTYPPSPSSFLCASILLSPLSRLSATSLLMLSQLRSFHRRAMRARSEMIS